MQLLLLQKLTLLDNTRTSNMPTSLGTWAVVTKATVNMVAAATAVPREARLSTTTVTKMVMNPNIAPELANHPSILELEVSPEQ